MTIDDAIEKLQAAKARGVKNIVLACWCAENFDKLDDQKWEETTAFIEYEMNWSSAYDPMKAFVKFSYALDLPVVDCFFSVRSRNCLQKMGIHTLGDLARTTEAEIIASKNFDELSLVEIKDMLASKGLTLGQLAKPLPLPAELELEEPSAQELLSQSIAELNLSVRARKCTTRLGVKTIGDLAKLTVEDLMKCKNFGVTSLTEVREKLAERGLRLHWDTAPVIHTDNEVD
jgi:DNA-directed RNA polymerase alpha subunit